MKYLVTPAPHKYSRSTITDMYITIAIGVFGCVLCGIINYKLNAIYILLACMSACVITEILFSLINYKKPFMDYSFLVTGLVLTSIMPINIPWYFACIAGFIAIASKYLFGGLGNNLFNPAALSRSIIGVMLAGMSFDYFGGDTPLGILLTGDKSLINLNDLVLGNSVSAIGTGCIVLILVLCVIALALKLIKWENILFSVAGFALMVCIFMGGKNVIPMLMSGSFVFVVVFMLQDPTTSSYGFSARCLNALLFGVLAGTMMSKNIMGETAVFLALLITNVFSPACDRLLLVFHKGVKKHD